MSGSRPSLARKTRGLQPRMRRADKLQETRRRLIEAAAKIVGAQGYANASVAKITALADVAQGTFYNYFASQQDLFDHLLPELGGQLLDFIRERVAGTTGSLKREELGFRAFFDFLAQRPEFYRILNEAETFSPKAFHEHMKNMADGYLRALRRSRAKSELRGFEERELEVIVYTLLAARNYLSYRFLQRDGIIGPPAEWIAGAYMKFIAGGMGYGDANGRTYRPRRLARSESTSRPVSYRFLNGRPGRAVVELNVEERKHDSKGGISRAILFDLFDAAGARAAASVGKVPRLLNLNAGFLGATTSSRLLAIAEADMRGELTYVNLKINQSHEKGETVATAQAIYGAATAHNSSAKRR
jgi:AcrR family transcriptional regulator/acyl-coenzyme A thioesterase PaaI-like protein